MSVVLHCSRRVLMEAIYKSANSGVPVKLKASEKLDAFQAPPAAIQL